VHQSWGADADSAHLWNMLVTTTPTKKFKRSKAGGTQRQSGVSLIEALVSLVVLALGVLGLAGLQTRTLMESRNTHYRAAAIQKIADLSERMQLNHVAARAGAYSALAFGVVPVATGNCLPANMEDDGAACSPDQMAASDLAQWRTELGQFIPNADATTFANLQNGVPVVGVMVAWSPLHTAKTNTDLTTALATFNPNTNANNVVCPTGLICHFGWVPLR